MELIAERLKLIKPSATLAVAKVALELKKQGKNIISLGVGEPDFDTPENIKIAAIKAICDGYTKYTNVEGSLEIKKAVQEKFLRENGLNYDLSEIIVGTGGKQVIYNLFMATLNNEDEVIIPAPYWVSYLDIVALAGGKPKVIECPIENGFKLTAKQLKQAISPKTKWLIINSPSNPTGAVYNKEELQEIADVLLDYPNVMIMSDDIYEHILFTSQNFYNIAMAEPKLKSRTFIINGVSKSYSMTGWRIGYGAGNKNIINAMVILQSQSTSNPSSISQMAAIEALNGRQDFIKINSDNFKNKKDFAIKELNKINGLKCIDPEGAFYIFPYIGELIGKKTPNGQIISNSNDFAAFLLEYAEVAVVPGVAFGLENYFRISTATSINILKDACNRIEKACGILN